MTENLKRFDPVQHYDMGGSGYGEMKECPHGDYVRTEDAQAEIDRLTEKAKSLESVMAKRQSDAAAYLRACSDSY